MKYLVTLFTRGRPVWRGEISASTAKTALTDAAAGALTSFTHASVQSDTEVIRFNRKFQKVRGDTHVFKTHAMYKPAIMLMVGKMPEIYRYDDDETRDRVFEELCTTCVFVESVKVDGEQIDITAYSGAMSDSKSGLTCQKISNGSVTSVTWQEKLIQSSIDKPFGKDNAKGSAKLAWSDGSKASPSNPNSTFLATIKTTLPQPGKDYVTLDMHDLIGQTIVVYKEDNVTYPQYKFVGAGWYWKEEWLDFNEVYAYVKSIPVYEEKDGLTFTPSMTHKAGQTLKFRLCLGSFPPHYTSNGFCYALDWLQPMGKQQFTDNYKATETYLTKSKFDEIAEKIYSEKKFIKDDAKNIAKAIKKIKYGEKKPDWSKYAALPLSANDEPKNNGNDVWVKPKYVGIDYSQAEWKKKYLEDLEKVNKQMQEDIDKLSFKYQYTFGVYKNDKKNLPPIGGVSV